ncbi:MAG: ankyrin repeat domain-containing protein [Alphaproteobacteria bacterium]|nr:MAG: ankyrin repeat domain-containing protein [Alphaproteobacteria bacterium]
MAFHWLESLADSFMPKAERSHRTSLEDDQKKFWHAVQKEYIDDIGLIAEKYPANYMTWETEDGNPLKTAQTWGCFSSFVELVTLGANIDQDCGSGWTPLLTALAKGDDMFVDYIIQHKVNLNAVAHDDKGRSYTALQLAIDHHDTDTIRMLVERGADEKQEIEAKDGTKMLPADYARSKGQPKAAEMLDLAEQIRSLHAPKSVPDVQQQIAVPAVSAPAPAPAAP